MSLVIDYDGNVHISYGQDPQGQGLGQGGALKYGFRPADQSRWFTMPIGAAAVYTNLKLDQQGNPHICATYTYQPVRYAHFDGKKWHIQEIEPDKFGFQVSCAVAIAPDGTPHLTWYKLVDGGKTYAHLRYAVLRDGAWMVRTLDFDGQTGKWQSLVLDSQGNPYVSYDAFVRGLLKYAHWDGKSWKVRVVDSRGSQYNVGMGNSLMLDPQENLHISYYTEDTLRYARQQNETWKIETVDTVSPLRGAAEYRSSVALDKNGFPHISYEDSGAVKHAYWDGKQWHIQVISTSGPIPYRFSSMAVDKKQDILYISYRDSMDGSLKVAIGRRVEEPQTTAGEKNDKK